MGSVTIANLKGPRGQQGPQGVPGVNGATTDAAVAQLLTLPSATQQSNDAVRAAANIDAGLIPRKPMDTPPLWAFTKGTALSIATIVSGGTGYVVGEVITLAGGTAVIPAKVKVASVSGGVITSVTTDTPGLYTVNPTSPTGQASSTGAGTGATFNGTWSGNPTKFSSGTYTSIAANDSTKIRFTGNGPTNISGSGGYGNTVGNATATIWEWETDAPYLEIRLLAFTTLAQLYINGQRVDLPQLSTDASAANVLYQLDFGASPVMRSYRLIMANSLFVGVRYLSSSSVTFRPPSRTRKRVWGLGDSYMFGNGSSDFSQSAFNIMCECLGLDAVPDGVGGAGWTGSTAGTPAARINAKLAPLTQTVDYIVFDMGLNNAANTTTDIQTGFNDAVAAAQAAKPGVPIIVFGPATPLGETSQLANVKAAIQARCTALNLTFIDVANWVSSSNSARYTGTDNVHPTNLGHAYLGARKAQAMRPYVS